MTKVTTEITSKTLTEVQEHYMDYPYPHRNPEEEKTRLLQLMGESLVELNHYLYKGKEDFKKGFRILIAGGGTGDSSTFLGDQLKNTDAEIVYLDFSKKSMEIAQKRAEIRGIKNIRWINDSILNIPNLNLGKFDYINCSGVLHHLSSPDDGLKILQSSLNPTGGMSLMVYAQIGRTGVYQIQELMSRINKGVTSRQEEVVNCNTIISALPVTNWYVHSKDYIADHLLYGDVGLYDMFLHKQDRAYTILELMEFIGKAGLNYVDSFDVNTRLNLRIENYVKDPVLLGKIKNMPHLEQLAICELLVGNIIKHSVYLSNMKDSVASLEDLDNIPSFFLTGSIAKDTYDYLDQNPSLVSLNITVNNAWLKDVVITINVSKYTKHIFKHLESGTQSLKEIFDAVRIDSLDDLTNEYLLDEVKKIFHPMLLCGILLLRDKSVIYP